MIEKKMVVSRLAVQEPSTPTWSAVISNSADPVIMSLSKTLALPEGRDQRQSQTSALNARKKSAGRHIAGCRLHRDTLFAPQGVLLPKCHNSVQRPKHDIEFA